MNVSLEKYEFLKLPNVNPWLIRYFEEMALENPNSNLSVILGDSEAQGERPGFSDSIMSKWRGRKKSH